MNIFRAVTVTPAGPFLIDAQHADGELGTVFIRPIVGGVVREHIPLCHFPDVKPLIVELQRVVSQIPS